MSEKMDIVARLREMCPTARDNTEEIYNRRVIAAAAEEIERLRRELVLEQRERLRKDGDITPIGILIERIVKRERNI